jgi:hypothetical protein
VFSSWAMNMEDNAGISIEQAVNASLCILSADNIIAGFLSRFPAPECKEQQEVVDAANKWRGMVKKTVEMADAFYVLSARSMSSDVSNN